MDSYKPAAEKHVDGIIALIPWFSFERNLDKNSISQGPHASELM